jgi:hypothetical protein
MLSVGSMSRIRRNELKEKSNKGEELKLFGRTVGCRIGRNLNQAF